VISAYCPSCQRITGHRRALGWATFFLVVVTGGLWLAALWCYKPRCVICGMLAEPARRTEARMTSGGTALLIVLALVVGIVVLGYLVAR